MSSIVNILVKYKRFLVNKIISTFVYLGFATRKYQNIYVCVLCAAEFDFLECLWCIYAFFKKLCDVRKPACPIFRTPPRYTTFRVQSVSILTKWVQFVDRFAVSNYYSAELIWHQSVQMVPNANIACNYYYEWPVYPVGLIWHISKVCPRLLLTLFVFHTDLLFLQAYLFQDANVSIVKVWKNEGKLQPKLEQNIFLCPLTLSSNYCLACDVISYSK